MTTYEVTFQSASQHGTVTVCVEARTQQGAIDQIKARFPDAKFIYRRVKR